MLKRLRAQFPNETFETETKLIMNGDEIATYYEPDTVLACTPALVAMANETLYESLATIVNTRIEEKQPI